MIPPPVTTAVAIGGAVRDPLPHAGREPVARRRAAWTSSAFGGRALSTIEIVDQSATLVGARTGQPDDGGSASTPDKADVANDPSDPATVVLTWTGLFDDDDRKLTIAPGRPDDDHRGGARQRRPATGRSGARS